MEQTKGQIRALDILKRTEAGEPRADIAASYGVGESSIYFETRFGRFLRYRAQQPDDRAPIGAWGAFDKLWSRTDQKAPEATRFGELICALPLAADVPAKAANAPRNARKAKTPAQEAAEAEAIVADSPLLRALDAEPTPESAPAPEPIAAPAAEPTYVDPIAAKRERKTIAQRLRRAAARAAQWPATVE